jgi:predicted Zn-dependent peptidase
MYTDRLDFKKDNLQNGVTIWSHLMDVPFTLVRIIIPVGTAHGHNKNKGVNGIAHFLEHMCMERSKLFPEKNSFEKVLSDKGGSWNAWTSAFYTTFSMQAPAENFDMLFQGLISQIFEPIFDIKDIALQREIIQNERQQNKYYPSDSELSQQRFTEWMQAEFFQKEQVFGTDIDLTSITPEMLTQFHNLYFSSKIQVFVGGTYDELFLKDILSDLKTKENCLIDIYQPYSWKHKDFHTIESKDVEMPIYSIGNLTSEFSLDDALGVSLLCDILTNPQYGTLNEWIRNEKGWSYGATHAVWYRKMQLGWTIDIPLNEESIANNIRQELHKKITQLLNDTAAINLMKGRIIKSMCFDFQTLGERIDSASEAILYFGLNFSEADYRQWIEGHCNSVFLKQIYDTHFANGKIGELLVVPSID